MNVDFNYGVGVMVSGQTVCLGAASVVMLTQLPGYYLLAPEFSELTEYEPIDFRIASRATSR